VAVEVVRLEVEVVLVDTAQVQGHQGVALVLRAH
jgi:hypothetical protein